MGESVDSLWERVMFMVLWMARLFVGLGDWCIRFLWYDVDRIACRAV